MQSKYNEWQGIVISVLEVFKGATAKQLLRRAKQYSKVSKSLSLSQLYRFLNREIKNGNVKKYLIRNGRNDYIYSLEYIPAPKRFKVYAWNEFIFHSIYYNQFVSVDACGRFLSDLPKDFLLKQEEYVKTTKTCLNEAKTASGRPGIDTRSSFFLPYRIMLNSGNVLAHKLNDGARCELVLGFVDNGLMNWAQIVERIAMARDLMYNQSQIAPAKLFFIGEEPKRFKKLVDRNLTNQNRYYGADVFYYDVATHNLTRIIIPTTTS